jgi:acyl-CoA dehydrogenase
MATWLARWRCWPQALLPPLVEADWQPYTAALLEPRYNFDPNDLRTLATPASSGYCLQGLKSFVPFAAEAAAAGLPMLVYARLSDRTQAFVVPSTAPGLRVIERQKTLGLNALPLYSLAFDDVQLGADSLLGGPDGHDPAPLLAAQQVAVAALGVGLARAALEYSCDYARERQAFGVKIAQKQAIAFMLAEMATEIEAIRLLTWQAAWSLDQLKPEASRLAYLAATGAADMAMQVTDRAVQILGGHGYIREHPVELWMRNGRGIATLAGLAMV